VVDGGEPGVDSRDEGKHTGRNDLLFVEKMMWMGERGDVDGRASMRVEVKVCYISVVFRDTVYTNRVLNLDTASSVGRFASMPVVQHTHRSLF